MNGRAFPKPKHENMLHRVNNAVSDRDFKTFVM